MSIFKGAKYFRYFVLIQISLFSLNNIKLLYYLRDNYVLSIKSLNNHLFLFLFYVIKLMFSFSKLINHQLYNVFPHGGYALFIQLHVFWESFKGNAKQCSNLKSNEIYTPSYHWAISKSDNFYHLLGVRNLRFHIDKISGTLHERMS